MDTMTQSSEPAAVIGHDAATVVVNEAVEGANLSGAEVFEAQLQWAQGIVDIGALFLANDDHVSRTHTLIDNLYGYDEGPVQFKPTLASKHPFRMDKNEATSYFIGGCIDEDLGFAIKPWEKVRFGEQHIVIHGTSAVAMGHYYFTEHNQPDETKVEFTFGYYRSKNGSLKINLHHSSAPYSP